MGFYVVIPARYESSRLPGKPLRELAGKPMLQHVYECARNSQAQEVIIATDDARIQQAAQAFGASVCLTSRQHRSGTERLAEVTEKLSLPSNTIIVNLQGDEPLMPHACINQVADALERHSDANVATLCTPVCDHREIFDPHVVKVVRDAKDYALYFSRAPIPWHREAFQEEIGALPENSAPYLRHIGLYAYRVGYLREYVSASVSQLEQTEALEQLRVLWHGGRIIVPQADEVPGPGVDTADDLEKVAAIMSGK